LDLISEKNDLVYSESTHLDLISSIPAV
jgi:hypothetical protein